MAEKPDANGDNRIEFIAAKRNPLKAWAANETVQAALVLGLLVNIFFFPFVWGNQTLLQSARAAPTITPLGAAADAPARNRSRTLDPWAPAWFLEPLSHVVGRVYLKEKTLPLWNPYAGYGVPLAAAMQPQTFHPLAFLLSLDPTPTAFNLFFVTRLWIAGFFTYLFLRLFLRRSAALAGAIAFMFTGYFILYLNMFHLTVEIMLPALFFAFELLYRRFDSRTTLLGAVTVLLTIIGGAPESTFLTLIFACCFYVLRFITKATTITSATKFLIRLTVVNIIGFGMASFLLMPFLEYVAHSFTAHTSAFVPGPGRPIALRNLLAYIAPLVFGSPDSGRLTFFLGAPNKAGGYFGVTATLLAMLAVVGWVADKKKRQTDTVAFLVPFFTLAAVIMIMKRYSIPPAQWLGYLPLFRRVSLNKYLEPLTGFCVAVLCGVGFSRVLARRCAPSHVILALGTMLTGLLIGCAILLREGTAGHNDLRIAATLESIMAALGILVVVTAILLMSTGKVRNVPLRSFPTVSSYRGVLLLPCLTAELFLIFIYPMFYKYNVQPDKGVNPFLGAPYISWLQQKDTKAFRVMARESFLHPNWAGVFGILDIRNLDALYPNKYLPFLRNFFPGITASADEDLYDRFTGVGPYYSFASLKARRLLQLSSVRYLITKTPFTENSLIPQFLEMSGSTDVSTEAPLAGSEWTISGATKQVLVQHFPSSPQSVKTEIEPGRTEFLFSLDIEPKESGGACGGVDFMMDVRDANGAVERVFHDFIKSYGNPADRHWFDERVNLDAYSGQQVELILSTTPRPGRYNCMGLAGWADMKFGKPLFNLVYDKEVRIYEYSSVLPRAAVFYQAEMAATEEQALTRLIDPEFNVFQRVVVTPSGLNRRTARQFEEMNSMPARDATPATIVRLESREIDIDASLDRRGILVLNDTNYPGWRAYVDGKEASILSANYLFRGVLLESGRHHLAFRYAPISFRVGTIISVLSAIGLLVAALFPNRLGLS
jgi:hypothetical protein